MRGIREIPEITSSSYVTSTVDYAAAAESLRRVPLPPVAFGASPAMYKHSMLVEDDEHLSRQETAPMANQRRFVQVLIADTNENVPLEDALLYHGEPKFTDANDQELFFEIDVNAILKAHNEKRVKIVDKKVKERTEYLEAAKIRDLKMVVVTIANF